LALLAAVVLLAGAGAAVVLTHEEDTPQTTAPPAVTPQPAPVRTPLLAATDKQAPMPTQAGLVRALQPSLAAPLLAGRVTLSVIDVLSGQPLLEVGAQQPAVPASTAKIATALAALSVLPGDQRLVTRVLAGAAGDVVLVGGGDPTLLAPGVRGGYPQPARLTDLAAQVAKAQPVVRRVVVDDRLFSGPRIGPGWKPVYLSDHDVAPVSALELKGTESADPALEAGRRLAGLLHVKAVVVHGFAPAGARELGKVTSAPVSDLVETMLATSDNDLAEALGRHVALATKQPATFDGAAAATAAVLQRLLLKAGVGATGVLLRDSSGLSPLDRVQPGALARLLAVAATDDRFGPLLSGLPVAGFDGTLADRYRKGPTAVAAGQVRAKTGTLTGVSALAGLVRTRSGRLLAFDVTANGLPEKGAGKAPQDLDAVAAALAACGCT
jgi:D-alanyl-D-alanine carboxypeptidase/D-alanyl-D-alanine-endopeptidase (penicillin-binding protein 4)